MRYERPAAATALTPLFVDVDGTLTAADISLESFVRFARSGVWSWLMLLWWIVRGRAIAKTMVARRMPIDPATLPYRDEVLQLIAAARAAGRPVILASASHWRNIARISAHLGLDGHLIATRGDRNLKGAAKLAMIRMAIGDGGEFDYVGDSRADLCLWREARQGWTTRHRPRGLPVRPLASDRRGKAQSIVKSMRPHQWSKNALVLVPTFTSGMMFVPSALLAALGAAAAMSLIASGIYLVNDMLDIDADRAHATKRHRPLARGDLDIPLALILAIVMTVGGLIGGWLIGGGALLLSLLGYVVLTTAYSFRLKAAMVADVIALASLYTVRIWIGAVAIDQHLTFWLLLFSIFLFLSLAYLKRYIELKDAIDPDRLISGRGYVASDLDIVMMSGVASGMVAILVLALFADQGTAGRYAAPQLLWLLCLPLLYWINRIWMMARRGEVEGDPVAFAMKDARSIAVVVLMGLIFVAAQYLTVRI